MARRAWVIIGVCLIVAGLGWWVVQVTLLSPTDRSNASGYGQFVLATVGTLLTMWQILGKRVLPDRAAAPSVDELTDRLAAAMREQWTAAAAERGLREPLPIRWRRSSEPVAGPVASSTRSTSFDPLPGITRVTAGHLREGTHRTLHRIYGGLASGRLIITGGPGTGKSSAAILLLIDALRYREQVQPDQRAQVPVPVLFTLHGWDPGSTPLQDWVTTKLTELAPLSGRQGRQHAADLLAAGRISVFLDGLDEIPAALRPVALRALSRQATFRLVLLTRTTELVAAAHQHILTGAAALELKPLTPADAAEYLHRGLTDPPPPAWQKVLDTLTSSADSPLAQALTIPFTITLLDDLYLASSAAPGPVDELLDTERFPDASQIADHLLDHAILSAYTPQPGQPEPPYTPATAQRTLTFIAERLRDNDTRDLAWWAIPTWTPRRPRFLLSVAVNLLIIVLVAGLPVALFGGLVVGLIAGLAWLASATVLALMPRSGRGGPPWVVGELTWNRASWRNNVLAGLTMGALWGALFGLLFEVQTGLLIGATVVVVGTLAWAVREAGQPDRHSRAAGPRELWRRNFLSGPMVGLSFGFVAAMVAWFLSDNRLAIGGLTGIQTGVLTGICLVFGLTIGLLGTKAWVTFVNQVYLWIRYRTPLRLGRFLEDARERHLLRTVGLVYQFRHATLQDRLAPPR